jgi:WD40 repeat protein
MTKPIQYEAFLKIETGTHTTRINQLLVTQDSKTLITAGEKTIRVWDVETKKQVRMLLGQIGTGATGSIQRIALSRDDQYVVALAAVNPQGTHGDLDRETDVRVYELATGNLQARSRYPGTLMDLDFSPDGKYLAMVSNPKKPTRRGYVEIYEWGGFLQGFGKISAPAASVPLYDYDALIPAYVRFVPDKQDKPAEYRIVVATWYQQKGRDPQYTGGLLWYSFTKSGGLTKLPASRETEERITPNSLAVSREYVVITGDVNKFFCHDHAGKLVATVLSESIPTAPAFSQDESRLIVGQNRDSALVEVSVYDIALGQFQLKSTYHGHDSEVVAVGFLKDGAAVSAGGDQNAIHFWNPSHFEGEQTGAIKGVGRVVHAVGINPEEQIGIGNYDDLRLEDGSILLQRAFKLGDMTLNALSIQDAHAFQRAQNRAGEQWLEIKSQEEQSNLYLQPNNQSLAGNPSVGGNRVTTFGFTENKTIVTGASDGKLQVAPRSADGRYQKAARFLVGHTGALRDHAASGRWLVTAGADQIIRLWFMEDVEQDSNADLDPALNLFVGTDDEWVIWSKSGYYHASQHGDRLFGYHLNRGPDKEALYFSSDRFIKAFFRPDIIQAIVKYGSEERAFAELIKQEHAAAPIEVAQILPPIVELTENGLITTKDKVTFTFTVEALNPDKPVTRVWIVCNEQFAWESQKQQSKYKVTLPLLPGRNHIKILAENESTKSTPLIHNIMGPKPQKDSQRRTKQKTTPAIPGKKGMNHRKNATKVSRLGANILLGDGENAVPDNGILYLLAVGVSNLEKPRPDRGFNSLGFAHLDALAIYNAFAKARLSDTLDKKAPMRNKAFRSVEATILLNQEATKAAILKAIDKICTKIKTRSKARGSQRDVLFVFLSGHGVRRTDPKTHDQELYFWNYDLDFDNTRGTGLSLIELGRKITSVPADVILTTDACHSGMAGGEVVKGLDPSELAKRIYAINERGMYILNAARSQEVAMESGRKDIQHGVFTKSILETLHLDNDVNMLNLIASVQQRVQYYTNQEQTPICRMYGDLLPLVVYQK